MNLISRRPRSLFVPTCVVLVLSLGLVPRAAAESGVTNAVGAGQLFNGGITNTIGVSGPFNALLITNGGVATNGVGIVGAAAVARSNSVVVSGTGSAWTNSGALIVGATGSWNQVTVSDGGFLFSAGASISLRNGTNNLVLVSGASTWTNAGALTVGGGSGTARGNQLVVSNGGHVYSSGNTIVSELTSTGPRGNAVIVTGSNSLFSNGGTFTLGSGNGAAGDWLIVTNGGTFVSAANVVVGGTTAVTGEVIVVSGPGSLLNSGASLSVGSSGGGLNRMIISDGGVAISTSLGLLGNAAGVNSNSAIVTGPGSTWTNIAKLQIGNNGSFNSLVISNEGTVTSLDGLVGSGSSTNNNVVITGIGSSWKSAGTLFVGTNAAGSGNVLLVNQGGLLEAKNLSVGIAGAITNSGGILQFLVAAPSITNVNKIVQDTGTIAFRGVAGVDVKGNVTGSLTNFTFVGANTFRLNAASNAASGQDYTFAAALGATNYTRLEMVNGATLWQGGSLTIATNGTMLVSNTAAVVANAFTNRGGVNVVNSTLTFNQSVVVESNGTFSLINATNVLGGGMVIGPNAVFGGSGLVNSSIGVTNFGTISPGNSPGTLTFTSNLTLLGSSVLTIEIGGTNSTDFDRLVANGTFNLGGTLNVSLINGFDPSNSVSFDIIDGGLLSGSFSTLNLPSAGWSFSDTTGVLSFTAIPEPGTMVLVSFAGLVAFALRRRRAA